MPSFEARAAAVLLFCTVAGAPAVALEPDEQRGQTFAQTNCAMCHAIGRHEKSQISEAPPFRILHERYDVDDLKESFVEGILTGHPSMPQWRLDPGQITDLIAYMKTLEH